MRAQQPLHCVLPLQNSLIFTLYVADTYNALPSSLPYGQTTATPPSNAFGPHACSLFVLPQFSYVNQERHYQPYTGSIPVLGSTCMQTFYYDTRCTAPQDVAGDMQYCTRRNNCPTLAAHNRSYCTMLHEQPKVSPNSFHIHDSTLSHHDHPSANQFSAVPPSLVSGLSLPRHLCLLTPLSGASHQSVIGSGCPYAQHLRLALPFHSYLKATPNPRHPPLASFSPPFFSVLLCLAIIPSASLPNVSLILGLQLKAMPYATLPIALLCHWLQLAAS